MLIDRTRKNRPLDPDRTQRRCRKPCIVRIGKSRPGVFLAGTPVGFFLASREHGDQEILGCFKTRVRGIMGFTPSLLSRGQTHLALVEGCRHSLEISIPTDEVESETSRAVEEVQKKARIKGFRPGKVPASLVKTHFAHD